MNSLLHSMMEEYFKKLAYDFVEKKCPSLLFQNWSEWDDQPRRRNPIETLPLVGSTSFT